MSLTISVYFKDLFYQLVLETNAKATIGSAKRDTLTLLDTGLMDAHFSFTSHKSSHTLSAKEGVFANGVEVKNAAISIGDVFTCRGVSVYICPKQSDFQRSVSLLANREIVIGRSKECSICLSNKRVSSRHAKISFESGKYKLIDLDSKNHTFVNGKMVSTHYLNDGDIISVAFYSIIFENGELSFLNTGDDLKVNLDDNDLVPRYPLFRRSPRLGNMRDSKLIEIQAPPQVGEKPSVNWFVVFLPPLVMIGVGVASMVLTNGSLMNMLFILPMSLVTIITTIISYFAQVRKFRQDNKKKVKAYNNYIAEVTAEIEEAHNQQLNSINNANPDTSYCLDIVSNRMRRLWERSANDTDFLDVRLGKGVLPIDTKVVIPKTVVGEDANPQLMQIQNEYLRLSKVQDIAVTLPLKAARTIGVVGNRQVAVKVVHNSIIQLSTHHSYTDLNVIIISNEKDYEQWSWARWLPHCWDSDHQIRYVSSDKKQASELLGILEDSLKKRADALMSDKYRDGIILPYLVFVITDYALAESRDFLRLVATAKSGLGTSAFLLFDSLSKLPKECDWIVDLNNSGGSVYSKNDSANKTTFVLDSFSDFERFSRAMAPIRDRNATLGSRLPLSVTFFQGYGINEASELNFLRNWKSAEPYKSLAVPIGTMENGKPFMFDIHEKAHGPHGLVAGTTGSGKSEVLQSWILSMCANFSPQDVSFVLIDFKGMGLAGALKGLPHIAGIISNVDENIQRNLFSLESELSRRQKLFASVSSDKMKIGDIYDYQDAYRQGRLFEPLSHLIIVVDEFAELKAKFPDFMNALDSAARVGRSLGVHLVLATQKPDGVVTDEVRANSKFKWCLRVANDSESKAVISRPEAASIPISTPGRTYIQVGNNEIFELIQTYYSGADIRRKVVDGSPVKVSFVDSIGRRETISNESKGGKAEQEKELLALVQWITNVHNSNRLPKARKIWENSLPKRLAYIDLPEVEWKSTLAAVIGLADDPRHQKQYPCVIDFSADGHLIIYGAPATGKTFLLQTIIMSLAERYTPDEVNIYIIDFGSWSMKNLQSLPHIGGVANGNEVEKLNNLIKMLSENLDQRKTVFAQIGASNLEAFRQATGKMFPSIVVIVDNFAPIREMYPEIENVFVRLSREGSNYGIYLVLTAASLSGSIGYNLSQNFKQALGLRMTEAADYRTIVGDTEGLEPGKIAGRGLMSGKPPMEFQTALAVDAANDVEYVALLKQHCDKIASEWLGNMPPGIPIMPDIVLPGHFKGDLSDKIFLGLSDVEISPVTIPFGNRFMLISGTDESGKTNLLQAIAKQLQGKQNIIFVSSAKNSQRESMISSALQKAAHGEQVTLLVDNLPNWLSMASYDEVDAIENLILDFKTNLFSLYATGDAAEIMQSGNSVINKMIQLGRSIALGGSFSEHTRQFEASNVGYSEQYEQLRPNYGYLIQKKKAIKFKAVFSGGSDNGI